MKKLIWIPLIILIIGVCIALAGFAKGGLTSGFYIDRGGIHVHNNDPGKLIKVDESYQSFESIEVRADFIERIDIKEGNAFTVRGQNYERYGGLEVSLEGGTLKVNAESDKKWTIDFGLDELFGKHDTWIEITCPAGTKLDLINVKLSAGGFYANDTDCTELLVNNSFGDIRISQIQSDKLTINASSGNIDLTSAAVKGPLKIDNHFGDVEIIDIKAGSLTIELDSGKLKSTNVKADNVNLTNDFGTIEINGMETSDLDTKLNSGNLKGSDVIADNIKVKSDFGDIVLDNTVFTKLCQVENSSGDVRLGLLMNRNDVSYELKTDAGSVTVDGSKSSGSVESRAAGASATLRVKANFGSIKVEFME